MYTVFWFLSIKIRFSFCIRCQQPTKNQQLSFRNSNNNKKIGLPPQVDSNALLSLLFRQTSRIVITFCFWISFPLNRFQWRARKKRRKICAAWRAYRWMQTVRLILAPWHIEPNIWAVACAFTLAIVMHHKRNHKSKNRKC